jgi:hypothetical protein
MFNRAGIDRRSGSDNRQVYALDYFVSGGIEQRSYIDRRIGFERRKDWTLITQWSSIYVPVASGL